MDFEEFFDRILKIDSKVRFVGIYQNRELFSKMQAGVINYLTKKEVEESLVFSLNNLRGHSNFKQKMGIPSFSILRYEKVYHVTLPLNDGLVLVITETDIDILNVITQVEKIKNDFEWVCKIVIVDDDRDMIESLSKLLIQKKIQIVSKGFNGKEAIDLYFSYKPDVILLDMKMPEYDGIYAINGIRAKDPNAKIIAISAYLDDYPKLDNVSTFLKPIEVDEVVEEILKLKNSK